MKSKAKSEKCPLPERIRKRISLSIDPETYAFMKKEGFNASRFFDSAIFALKTNTEYRTILITTGISPNPDLTTKIKPRAGIEPATSSLPRIDNSGEIREKSESALDTSAASEFSELRGEELITLISKHGGDSFKQFLTAPKAKYGRGIKPEKAQAYVTGISQIREMDLNTPDQIIALDEPLKENQAKGLRAFFDYLEIHHNQKTISGDDLSRWRSIVKTPTITPGKVAAYTNEEAEALYHAINPKIRIFYKFLIYTGMRIAQAYRILSDLYDDEIFKPDRFKKIAYIETDRVAESATKNTSLAVFPREFIPELMKIRNNIGASQDFIEKTLVAGGKAIQPHFMHLYTAREKADAKETGKPLPARMSGKITRKFHAQVLTDNNMDSVLVDYLQGRNISVGHSRYGSPIVPIMDKYTQILEKPARPFPDFTKPAPKGITVATTTTKKAKA